MPAKLAEVYRSDMIESVHRGDIAICTSRGEILYEAGNPDRYTFFRSASKPLQIITALEFGIAEEFKLDLKDIAIFTSSHSGEKEHIRTLENIIEKTGLKPELIKCGIHDPIDKDAERELIASGQKATNLHCNCSGKHIAIILALKAKGMNIESYTDNESEIQKKIDKIISEFSNIPEEKIIKATDGCGMPVHAVPLKNMAQAYANLSKLDFSEGKYKKSQNYVLSAMTMYPELVAGTGRLDTVMMKNFGDRIVCKIGAEGVFCVSLLGKAVGIAIKIDDGNSRAIGPVILEVLSQIGVIDKSDLEKVTNYYKPQLFNHKGEKVGEIKAKFTL